MIQTISYPIADVVPYINWLYFFHAWQLPTGYASLKHLHRCPSCRAHWVTQYPEAERDKVREGIRLYDEACDMLEALSEKYVTLARLALFDANSDGDDLVIYTPEGEVRLPLLRQQHGNPCLCLADFIRPKTMNRKDRMGVFATTIDSAMETLYADDPYRHMLVQTLCDRLAEATAERLHEEVRKKWWGYAPDEDLTPEDMFQCRFTGIRPAVGYPSLPDQSVNFLLDELTDFKAIGIRLTENGAMLPHGSVSGLMLAHPKATYFAVGKIGKDQFQDYVSRRGLDEARMRQFLRANL